MKLVESKMKKLKLSIQRFCQGKTAKKEIPFVVTNHPLLKPLSKIIHDNLYLLYMNEENIERENLAYIWSVLDCIP